jgi:hypothetical protein
MSQQYGLMARDTQTPTMVKLSNSRLMVMNLCKACFNPNLQLLPAVSFYHVLLLR